MRTRERKYNIKRREFRDAVIKCRNLSADEEVVLMECARMANEQIAEYLFESIRYNRSYEKLSVQQCIPISKVDFYAYRRKAIAMYIKRT